MGRFGRSETIVDHKKGKGTPFTEEECGGFLCEDLWKLIGE